MPEAIASASLQIGADISPLANQIGQAKGYLKELDRVLGDIGKGSVQAGPAGAIARANKEASAFRRNVDAVRSSFRDVFDSKRSAGAGAVGVTRSVRALARTAADDPRAAVTAAGVGVAKAAGAAVSRAAMGAVSKVKAATGAVVAPAAGPVKKLADVARPVTDRVGAVARPVVQGAAVAAEVGTLPASLGFQAARSRSAGPASSPGPPAAGWGSCPAPPPSVNPATAPADAPAVEPSARPARRESAGGGGSLRKYALAGLVSGGVAAAAMGAGDAIHGAASGIADFAKSSLDLAGEAEQVSMAFEVLLGSATKAETTLGGLKRFAAETPFSQKEIVSRCSPTGPPPTSWCRSPGCSGTWPPGPAGTSAGSPSPTARCRWPGGSWARS